MAIWSPEFTPNEQIVFNKFRNGYYPKPPNLPLFNRHLEIIDLKIDKWKIENDYFWLGGFCKIHYKLTITFQATLEFVQKQFDTEYIPDINNKIKSSFFPLIEIIVETELKELDREIKDDFNKIKQIIENELEGIIKEKKEKQKECNYELIKNLRDELWRKHEREIDFSTFISKREDCIAKAVIDELTKKQIICQSFCELIFSFIDIKVDDDEPSADFIHQEIYNFIKTKITNLRY